MDTYAILKDVIARVEALEDAVMPKLLDPEPALEGDEAEEPAPKPAKKARK